MLSRASTTWRASASRHRTGTQGQQWTLVTRRSYATGNDGEGGQRRWPGVLLGTATTSHAHRTSIEGLLQQVKPQSSPAVKDSLGKPALLTLLLTPTFAQHAFAANLPLRVLQRLHDGESAAVTKPVDVITAVVDRLPSTAGPSIGQEGLAYMFLRNPGPLSVVSQTRFNPSAQKPGSLSFEVPTTGPRPWQYTIQLPLAQTIFSTGKVSTLVHTRYDYDKERHELVQQKQQPLESQTLRLPFTADHSALATQVPLVPLTPVRTVRNHMGNIVRTLSSSVVYEGHNNIPQHTGAQPASQELEAAVSAYFTAKNISPEPVQVWALIIPERASIPHWPRENRVYEKDLRTLNPDSIRDIWSGKSIWKGKSEKDPAMQVDASILRCLRSSGARLHRVLSGGGGWGKKAGLLSLDPDVMYSSRELRADEGWEFDFEDESEGAVERQQRAALGEIVREGESIFFFIAPSQTSEGSEEAGGVGGATEGHRAQAMEVIQRADRAVLFGVVPSTVDAIAPPEATIEGNALESGGVNHHPGLFGALSETGLALTIMRDGQMRSRTKFDVPFSHIRITEEEANIQEVARLQKERKEGEERKAEARKKNEEAREEKLKKAQNVPFKLPKEKARKMRQAVHRVTARLGVEGERKPPTGKATPTDDYFQSAEAVDADEPEAMKIRRVNVDRSNLFTKHGAKLMPEQVWMHEKQRPRWPDLRYEAAKPGFGEMRVVGSQQKREYSIDARRPAAAATAAVGNERDVDKEGAEVGSGVRDGQ